MLRERETSKKVSAVALVLLLASLFLAFRIQRARSEPATIIVPDDYPTIQEAVDAALDGDTVFVRAGTYHENVWVQYWYSRVRILGESRDTVIVNGSIKGFLGAYRPTVENLTIMGDVSDDRGGTGWTVVNNTIHGKVAFTYESQGHTIAGNTIRKGVTLGGDYGSVIVDNVIYGGIQLVSGYHQRSSSDIEIANNILIGGGGYTNSSIYLHVFAVANDIINNTIVGASIGIHEVHEPWGIPPCLTGYNNIVGNTISGCEKGIWFENPGFEDPGGWDYGVSLSASEIQNNTLENNHCGIYLQNVTDVVVSSNRLSNNTEGIKLHGTRACDTVVADNLIAGNEQQGVEVDESFDNTVSGNQIESNATGIGINNSRNSSVSRNILVGNVDAIVIRNSTECVVDQNIVGNNTHRGILVTDSENFTVSRNLVYGSGWYGINANASRNGKIVQNRVYNNSLDGIGLFNSSHCEIVENEVSNNVAYGILIDAPSSYNAIYHNNIISNGIQAVSSSLNVWDNGCEGNFWSNYNGSDFDGDGIGDEYLPWEGVDDYPLMNPFWNLADINHDLKVDIYDVVLISDAYFSTPIDPEWNPHCDLVEPYGLINIYDVVQITGHYGKEYEP